MNNYQNYIFNINSKIYLAFVHMKIFLNVENATLNDCRTIKEQPIK